MNTFKQTKAKVIITGKVNSESFGTFAKAELLNQKFSVLPAIMMVEGAYTPCVEDVKSEVGIYFSSKELKQSVDSWNGRPVSLNHPQGQETCNSPDNYQKRWLGYVFNTRYDNTVKGLRADLWIEEQRGGHIVDRASKGSEFDVSIGAFGDLISISGKIGKTSYEYKMTNIIGDHLAVLPDGIGACSWKDGCGIRAKYFTRCDEMPENKDNKTCIGNCGVVTVQSILSTARTPSYAGVEDVPWGSVDKSLTSYITGYYKHTGARREQDGIAGVKDMPEETKKWIASKSLLGNPKADVEKDLIFFPVVNPETNKLNKGALNSVLSGRGSQANISTITRESVRKKAEILINSKFENDMEKVMAEKETLTDKIKSENDSDQKDFDVERWLTKAPDNIRNYLVNSIKNYETIKSKHVENITSFKKIKFCKDELNKIKDMEMLKNLSDLVDLANAKEIENKSDYSLKANVSGTSGSKLGFAQFKDIVWGPSN